jgi:hypothetical protein
MDVFQRCSLLKNRDKIHSAVLCDGISYHLQAQEKMVSFLFQIMLKIVRMLNFCSYFHICMITALKRMDIVFP